MSYILDALRKSEAERARGEAPSLLTSTDPHRVVPRYVIWLLIAILAINALLLAVWLVPLPAPDTAPPAAIEPSPAPDSGSVAVSDRGTPSQAPPIEVVPPEPRATVEAASRPAAPPARPSVPRFEISTHVYSEYPDLRAVTIDGRRYSEGEEIITGVWLVEITEDGVIIESDGLQSRIDVLQDWR